MHELSIATAMLELAGKQLGGPQPLRSVKITVGPLSGVCIESLRFCFDEVAEQLGFGHPHLEISAPPAQARCTACHQNYPLADMFTVCPGCDSLARSILSGEELTINEVELEETTHEQT